MNLIQYFESSGNRRVGVVVDPESFQSVQGFTSLFEMAQSAVEKEASLEELVLDRLSGDFGDYEDLVLQKRLLPPVDHPDPAHCMVTGTGLTQ